MVNVVGVADVTVDFDDVTPATVAVEVVDAAAVAVSQEPKLINSIKFQV